jgi:hypothetical protein
MDTTPFSRFNLASVLAPFYLDNPARPVIFIVMPRIVQFTCARNVDFFKKQLALDPALKPPGRLPELRHSLSQQSFEWKAALRSYDQARLDLRIAKPMQIQRANSITRGFKPQWLAP